MVRVKDILADGFVVVNVGQGSLKVPLSPHLSLVRADIVKGWEGMVNHEEGALKHRAMGQRGNLPHFV